MTSRLVLLSDRRLEKFLAGEYVSREMENSLKSLEAEFGFVPRPGVQRVLRAVAACRAGVTPESVARFLDWREFEMFCAGLLRARGYTVIENITLTRPRMQIDILARSRSLAFLVDCKHWRHGMGAAVLAKAAAAQAERARIVRARMRHLEPMVVVLLVLSNEEARFVDGAAVVPIGVLKNFLESIDSYSSQLELT